MNKDEKLERIETIEAELEKLKQSISRDSLSCNDDKLIFVPKSIKISSYNSNSDSAVIMNDLEQGIYKARSHKGFVVTNWTNDNTGKNYKLVEVAYPEPNKLYFIVQGDDLSYTNYMFHYIITIDKDNYVYWNNNDKLRYGSMNWDHYYEVVRIDKE